MNRSQSENWVKKNAAAYNAACVRYMKVKRMGITEILKRIWLISANKIKSSESFSK